MVMTAEENRGGRARPSENPGVGDRPGISWSIGAVRLHAPDLFADPGAGPCRSFLRRIFRLDEVRSVEIDRCSGTATIRYTPGGPGIAGMLDRMASALRGEHARDEDPGAGPIPPLDGGRARLKVSRYGTTLSTWEVVHELPGRVRFRNEALRPGGALAQRITQELATVDGVEACQVRPLTASLLVRFDPAAIDTRQLLQVLDNILHGEALSLAYAGDPHPARFGLPNASLGLAAAGEFALPVLLPASAVLLVASNVKTFKVAWYEVRRRQFGLPVLYTAIIVATLSSGQFLAASLMSWMLTFWRRQHREELLATRRRLLPGVAQHRRFARLCAAGAVVEVPLERLRPGDLILVLPGELIPADGRVVRGTAVVDERLIRGVDGLTRLAPGDDVFAGSRVIAGELGMEVTGRGPTTRAAALSRAILAASTPSPSTSHLAVTAHGETFARRAVVPTLATAGLGLLAGDLTTAAAVLRPDYATGPGLGVSLELLHDVAACAREGILIRDASAFRRLAEVDLILFDHHPALERPRLEVETALAFDGGDGDAVLRYAATAFRDLAGERTRALFAACQARGIRPLDVQPGYLDHGVVFRDADGCVTVADAVAAGPSLVSHPLRGRPVDDHPAAAPLPPPLLVSVDGRAIGQVAFRRDGRSEAASVIRDLRGAGSPAVGLLSSRPVPEAGALAEALGIDLHRGEVPTGARADLLRWYRERGVKVAYIGDCRLESRASGEAHVSVSLSDAFDPEGDPAQVVLLPGDLARICGLMALARSHVSRVRAVHGSILIPNLACIAGAFLFGFTSLSSVVLTNLGTLGVYSRYARRARLRRAPLASRTPAGAAPGRSRVTHVTSRGDPDRRQAESGGPCTLLF